MACPEQCCVGITGTLETMSLDEAVKLIHEAGCAYAYSLGPETTCLIVGRNPAPSAMAQADQYGIKLIWENQFFENVTQNRCGGGAE